MANISQIKLPNGDTHNFIDTASGYTKNTGTITSVKTAAGAHSVIDISSGAVNFNVPTKTSHLTNDSGFVTTDEKVKQSVTTTTSWRKVLLHYSTNEKGGAVSTATNQVYAAIGVEVNPSTGTLAVSSLNSSGLIGGGSLNITGPATFGDTVSIDDLNAGQLVVSGSASFANTINGNIATASALKDSNNGNSITACYSTGGVTDPSYYCAWDGYKITYISKANLKSAINTNTTYSAGTGLSLSSTTFSVKLDYTTSGNNRAVQADSNGNLYVTQKDDNTTYSSKAAASGGTDVSLVTTGEKYTWNSKTSNTGTITSVKTTAGAHTAINTTSGAVTFNVPTTAAHVGALASNGTAVAASTLAHKTLNDTTIDNTAGTFAFSGSGEPWGSTDWVGFQVGDSADKFQFTRTGTAPMFRYNDSGGTNSSNWSDWSTLYSTSNKPTAADIGIKFGYSTSGNNRAVLQDSSGNLYVTQKDTDTTVSTLTLAEDTGTSAITLAHGGKYKLTAGTKTVIFTMPASGNTDTKVAITAVTPASETTNYVLTHTATSGTTGVEAHAYNRFWYKQGSTSVNGYVYAGLGNNVATGTANNSQGYVRLYGPNTGYGNITYANTTANSTHTLPSTSGTILNTGTTSFTQSLTSGTKVGTIKINGTETILYAPTNTNTTYSAGTGLSLSSTTFNVKLGYATSGNNRAVLADDDGNLYVTQRYTSYSSMTAAEITAGNGTTARVITPANLKTAIETWSERDIIQAAGTGSTSLAAGTITQVPLTTTLISRDTYGCFTVASNRIAINKAGIYRITGSVYVSPTANTHIGIYIRMGTGTFANATEIASSLLTGTTGAINVTKTIKISSTQYVYLGARCYGNAGTVPNNNDATYLEIEYLGN